MDTFIRKYFWGCSYEFVRLGFKARIYRTFISVITQFHFSYAWRAYCNLPLEASARLDRQGIDALITLNENTKVALQIKKETYRSEARSGGRFAQRETQTKLVIEIPYTITQAEAWKRRAQRARKEQTRTQAQLFRLLAERYQMWLPNGFVIFQHSYPQAVERIIQKLSDSVHVGTISWRKILEELAAYDGHEDT